MAKDDEKYRWDWGTQTFPTIDPHSKIKHQIIDEYIQTYIDVLMRNQLMPELGLSIVDETKDYALQTCVPISLVQFTFASHQIRETTLEIRHRFVSHQMLRK